jgi:hypothetical protein
MNDYELKKEQEKVKRREYSRAYYKKNKELIKQKRIEKETVERKQLIEEGSLWQGGFSYRRGTFLLSFR